MKACPDSAKNISIKSILAHLHATLPKKSEKWKYFVCRLLLWFILLSLVYFFIILSLLD